MARRGCRSPDNVPCHASVQVKTEKPHTGDQKRPIATTWVSSRPTKVITGLSAKLVCRQTPPLSRNSVTSVLYCSGPPKTKGDAHRNLRVQSAALRQSAFEQKTRCHCAWRVSKRCLAPQQGHTARLWALPRRQQRLDSWQATPLRPRVTTAVSKKKSCSLKKKNRQKRSKSTYFL